MKSLDSLRQRAETIVANEPIWVKAFPPQPWDPKDLEEIADVVENVLLKNEVLSDDPWVDWLDRWKFHTTVK